MPTAAQSAAPSVDPTVDPTAAPSASAAPIADPTIAPSLAPTSSPTPAPSAPTAGPTAAPSGPTRKPSPAPTVKPTRMPTVIETNRPTRSPTPAPTIQTSPLVSFTSDISMGGLSEPVLDSAAQQSIVIAAATSMGVDTNTVFYVGATFSEARRALRQDVSLLATYNAVATTKVDIPLDSTGYTNATALWVSLTTALDEAVALGTFTTTMQQAAESLDATVLFSADATGVQNSAPTVDVPPEPTDDDHEDDDDGGVVNGGGGGSGGLAGGAIAGIVIAVLVGAALVGALFYYVKTKGVSLGGSSGPVEHEVFSSRSHIEIAL